MPPMVPLIMVRPAKIQKDDDANKRRRFCAVASEEFASVWFVCTDLT